MSPSKPSPAEPLERRVQALRLPAEKRERSNPSLLPWVLCCVLALTTGGFAFLALRPQPSTPEQPDPGLASLAAASDGTSRTRPASASEKPEANGELVLESKGYVIPTQQILVSPQVSGRLVRLNIEEGMRVEQGQILAEIERTEYEADHKRATAALRSARQRLLELERGNRPEEIEQARKELEEASAQVEQFRSEHERSIELRSSNVLTQREFDISEINLVTGQRRVERLQYKLQLLEKGPRIEQIEIARAQVEEAEAELDKADWRLNNCIVRAPIAGTILRKNAEEGNIVNPVAFNGSYSLCEMADLADLEVDLNIQERDIARVFRGQKCQIRAEAFPSRIYDGFVTRLMPIADRAKGAVPVRVKIAVPAEEEGVYLKPEMGATVAFFNSHVAEQPAPNSTADEGKL